MTVPDRYLLYVDILGFSDLVRRSPERIRPLYTIIDELAVHRHYAFKSIVFSDTILAYSTIDSTQDHEYFVMYSCEFVQELLYALVGHDIYFRAVLQLGGFDHYRLTNTECFYGTALINAYLWEKDIVCTGLFVDQSCRAHCIFPVADYDDKFSYVYLYRGLESLRELTGDTLPFTEDDLIYQLGISSLLAADVQMLKDIHFNMTRHPRPDVRAKHLMNWQFLRFRYRGILDSLEAGGFNLEAISPTYDWSERTIPTYDWRRVLTGEHRADSKD